jgi:hypothetical protein
MHRGARATANYSGAMEAGGRWNPTGTPMRYTAEHLSLACVEILDFLRFTDLDHVSSRQAVGDSWVRAAAQLPISSSLGRDPGRVQYFAWPLAIRLQFGQRHLTRPETVQGLRGTQALR